MNVTTPAAGSGATPAAGSSAVAPAAAKDAGLGGILKSGMGLVKDIAPVAGLAGMAEAMMTAKKAVPAQTSVNNAAGNLGAQGGALTAAATQPLLNSASALSAQGNQLAGYLTTGTLPPGVSAGLDQAYNSAVATIKSQYAARGQSGSSSEADALSNLAFTKESQGATIATNLLSQGITEQQFASQVYQQLLSQGLSASEYSSQLYTDLMNQQIAQDTALSNSIANFSGALAKNGASSTTTG
jgi:hypothetical protein